MHGSSPHMANDIIASSPFVTAVQTIISRRLNPFKETYQKLRWLHLLMSHST
ncbi:hypothetical protein JN080_27060 [Bacillus sp. EB600]|nr:hypothetical protein [Bacillus sp. EB600]MCQ6282763.1 hypothetical protein [Bacillus sp. EB600]